MKSKITGADIAKLANVSQSTVSRALDPRSAWRISAEKRSEILALCQQYGYPVDGGIKKGHQTFKIGFVLERMEHDLLICRFMFRRLCDMLQASGYTLTLIRVDFSTSEMKQQVRRVIKSNIADVYIIGSSLLNGQTIELLHSINQRIICFYAGFAVWKPPKFHSILSTIRYDYEISFQQAVEQMPQDMLKDMIFFGHNDSSAECKLHQLRKCLRQQHLSISSNSVMLYGDRKHFPLGMDSYRFAIRYIRENIEKIIGHKLYWTESSHAAKALKEVLEQHGSICGRDFEIITHHFVSGVMNRYSRIEDDFCNLVQNEDQFADVLTEQILALVENPLQQHTVIPTRFEMSDSMTKKLKSETK